jgi:hypothetical protein
LGQLLGQLPTYKYALKLWGELPSIHFEYLVSNFKRKEKLHSPLLRSFYTVFVLVDLEKREIKNKNKRIDKEIILLLSISIVYKRVEMMRKREKDLAKTREDIAKMYTMLVHVMMKFKLKREWLVSTVCPQLNVTAPPPNPPPNVDPTP